MPQVSAEVVVPVPPDVAFAVSQTTGELRLTWDPFIRRQYFLRWRHRTGQRGAHPHDARLGPAMTSEYVSFRPPTSVGMTMVQGPWFFARFGGGWRFEPHPKGTRAVWKYTYSVRPAWLRRVAEPIGQWLLGREIRRRIEAFGAACRDREILDAVGS